MPTAALPADNLVRTEHLARVVKEATPAMICPHCRTSNPEAALRCSKCGLTFSVVDEGETLGPAGATAPSAAPQPSSPAVASGVLSPPPGSSGTPASFGVWSAATGSLNLDPGTEFGQRYRIEALLGEGGMGAVYKAFDKDLDRTIALKLLRPGLMADPTALQRFKQELLLASKISHKNILRIHDLGDVGGVKFISMAYVEGDDLHRILKKQGRLSIPRAVAMARQLCAALEAAHAEGVVHRDLKPHNVLVDAQDNTYISDFGLAKSLDLGAASMTKAGEFLGTPRYMSPEQVEGAKLDRRSDLYSLGLIFYEMVTGDVPFISDSTLNLMYMRVKQKPKSPEKINPEIPAFLSSIIMRCLEKDLDRRYQSAAEILEDLDAGSGTGANRMGMRSRAGSGSQSITFTLPRPEQRKWWYLSGGVLLAAALTLAIPSVRHRVFPRTAPDGSTSEGPVVPRPTKFVAVLPLRILGDEKQLGYIGEGLVDAISAKLFQLHDVHVASATEARKVNQSEPLAKIAQQLGVSLVVQGTLQGNKDRIRVVLNLEDVKAGQRLWSQEFSGLPEDLLVLEDSINAKIMEALKLQPGIEERARLQAHPTENVEAYELYLRGRNAMRGQQQVKNVETAIRFYEDALKKDPRFALAYTGIADASLVMYQETKNSQWSQKALSAAEQARGLNDTLPEVHSSLGTVFRTTGKLAEAIVELRRAVELAPNSDEGFRRLGAAYLAAGRKDEAIQAYRKAIEINPYYWVNYNWMGNTFFELGEYEKAREAYRRMTELEPQNAFGFLNIGATFIQQGKYDECIPWLQKALAIQPHPMTYSNLGTAYFFLKRYEEAVPMFEKAVQMSPDDQFVVGNLADAYRWAGRKDKAQAAYDKAIALGYKELEVNPRKASTVGLLALYFAKRGDAAQADNLIRRARSMDAEDVDLIYYEATVHALAGRPEEALKAVREAIQKGYSLEDAKSDPELGSLHGRQEWQSLLRGSGKTK